MKLELEVTESEFDSLLKALNYYRENVISYEHDFDKAKTNQKVRIEKENVDTLKLKIGKRTKRFED